jgi:predicted transposase YdaD
MNLSTVYQNLKEDWRKEGQQEGENIAMKKVAIVLLREGVTIEIIQKATGLTIVQIQQLRDRIATGETPDSIIQ